METNKKKAVPNPIQVKMNVTNEQPFTKYCNFASISVTKEEAEVILDFIYLNRTQVNEETKEVKALHVDRIAMTIPHAKRFAERLTSLLKKL
jgi:hypothetical protein